MYGSGGSIALNFHYHPREGGGVTHQHRTRFKDSQNDSLKLENLTRMEVKNKLRTGT